MTDIVEAENLRRWRVTGQAVIGSGHLGRQLPCQDAFAVEVLRRCMVIVVSDGAGSARFPEVGAKVVTEKCVELLRRLDRLQDFPRGAEAWEKVLRGYMLKRVRVALEAEARVLNVSLADLACTLLLVVVTAEGLVGLQIGDGGIVYRLAGEKLQLLGMPSRGEFVNETDFVTGAGYEAVLQFRYVGGDVERVAVFSDGLQRLALVWCEGGCEVFELFFEPFFKFMLSQSDAEIRASKLSDFLASERVCARTDDDKTLVLAIQEVVCVSVAAESAGN